MGFWSKKKTKQKKGKSPKETPLDGDQPARQKRRHASLEVKVLAAEARLAGLSATEVAKLVGFSQASVDKWTIAYKEGGPQALCKQARSTGHRRLYTVIEERIEEHRRERPEHGVRRIRDDLKRNEGLEVSAETVRRVVNDAGLGNPPPQSKRRPPRVRRFERSFPNAMWQIDIMTFQLKRLYPVYLVGMIDDHCRFIVGHGLFRQQTAEAVLEVVKGAIGQWGAPRELLSDNGRQFVAWRGKTRFQKVLKQQGIQHVRSAPHHPMTLGKIERFWRTIWEEFLCEAVFASFADACQRIEHWVAYYNHQRVHQGIDGACPADRFYGLADDVDEAVRQGCGENSLRLALGQEPKPPLYLMGKLGGADVRVQRQGDGIEVKVGDAVHEVIELGAPYIMGPDGLGRRGGSSDEVEGPGRSRTVQGDQHADAGPGDDQRAEPDLWCEPPDAEPGAGQGGGCGGGGALSQAPWPQGQERAGGADCRAADGQGPASQGAVSGEEEGPDSPGIFGAGAEAGTRRGAAWRGKKKEEEEAPQASSPPQEQGSRWPASPWADDADGRGR
jgi:transposase InsO family protein